MAYFPGILAICEIGGLLLSSLIPLSALHPGRVGRITLSEVIGLYEIIVYLLRPSSNRHTLLEVQKVPI